MNVGEIESLFEMERGQRICVTSGLHRDSRWAPLREGSLAFLKDLDMMGAYLTILSMARSVRDVRRLHNLLPDNCQLLKPELQLLDKMFREIHDGNPPKDGQRVSDGVARLILKMQCPHNGLCDYYLYRLDVDRPASEDWFDHNPDVDVIHTSEDSVGHGYDHFRVYVGNLMFWVGAYYNTCTEKFGIRLWYVGHWHLTASITQRLLEIEAFCQSTYGNRSFTSNDGAQLDFWWTTDAYGLIDYTAWEGRSDHRIRVIREFFTDQLCDRLQSIGLPIDNVGCIDYTTEDKSR